LIEDPVRKAFDSAPGMKERREMEGERREAKRREKKREEKKRNRREEKRRGGEEGNKARERDKRLTSFSPFP
jgi:hypothetical protein